MQPHTKAPANKAKQNEGRKPIRRALLSVTDKTGLVEFRRSARRATAWS